MKNILFTTYPDGGPCFMVTTDMPVAEAEKIEFTTMGTDLMVQIIKLGYKVKTIERIDAVMDWVNGFVEER